ncbi:MAG: hypothetical protein HYT63_03415 [Candidatus Yanofskybacteria bacterium]|nr:hypothetical protein [Candidatus Yanofskybacteria bacterium]
MEKEENLRELAEAEVTRLKELIFRILPEDCLLRPGTGLNEVGVIDPDMLAISPSIPKQFLDRRDICMLCRTTVCPWNSKVGPEWAQWFRALKIYLLGRIFRNSGGDLVDSLNKSSNWEHEKETGEVR